MSGFVPPASCWLQHWDAEPGSVLPAPIASALAKPELSEIVGGDSNSSFFTGSGAKLTGEFKVEALSAKSSSGGSCFSSLGMLQDVGSGAGVGRVLGGSGCPRGSSGHTGAGKAPSLLLGVGLQGAPSACIEGLPVGWRGSPPVWGAGGHLAAQALPAPWTHPRLESGVLVGVPVSHGCM